MDKNYRRSCQQLLFSTLRSILAQPLTYHPYLRLQQSFEIKSALRVGLVGSVLVVNNLKVTLTDWLCVLHRVVSGTETAARQLCSTGGTAPGCTRRSHRAEGTPPFFAPPLSQGFH